MIGQTISHYTILDKLGEGGMGVVYKAQDTTLERIVALKFLPDHVAQQTRDLDRFMLEAKAAASLNHPNICTIYGIEQHEGKHFIAMEFVDGHTLQELKSSLSMKQAIDFGMQIAEGLSAAHEKGIVHRDIKPENVIVRKDGRVQIMDFGLAKLQGVSRLTKEGSTVGTAGYMSPEQVQGLDADHRSDIFSLGVLLYEMMTKTLPFKGVHETAIAYEIVNVDSPPMSSIDPEITPELDAIVLECLEKDPNERAQSAKQVAIDLRRFKRSSSRVKSSRITSARYVAATGTAAREEVEKTAGGKANRNMMQGIVTGLIIIGLLAGGFFSAAYFLEEQELPVIHGNVILPDGVVYRDASGGNAEISPDGSKFVFSGVDSTGKAMLWILSLKTNEAKPLIGTDLATYPFWSFDSRSIGFFSDGKLKTIDAHGGPTLVLADAPFGRGGAWSKNGEIIFSPSVSDVNLYRVSSSGGTPTRLTNFDSTLGFVPRFPVFLPDGDHFVFTMLALQSATNNVYSDNSTQLYVGSLKDGEMRKILSVSSYGRYASGYMLYMRQGILVAQPFDEGNFTFSGKPLSIQGGINSWAPRAKADFSVSANGILVYAASASARNHKLLWVDDEGTESVIGEFEYFGNIDISADKKMIVYDHLDPKTQSTMIYTYDIERKTSRRLNSENILCQNGIWSKDGKRIYYNAEINGSKSNILVSPSDGAGTYEVILRDTVQTTFGYYPMDVSPDGTTLLIDIRNESGSELGVIDLRNQSGPYTVRRLGVKGNGGILSQNGKWILYASDASGYPRLLISALEGKPGTWEVPIKPWRVFAWENDRILYYSPDTERQEYLDVTFPGDYPVFGTSQPVFKGNISQNINLIASKDNGKKFLAFRPANAGRASSPSFIVNWHRLMEKE